MTQPEPSDQRNIDEATRDLARRLAAMQVAVAADADAKKLDSAVEKLPGKGEWVKAAPGIVVICVTVILMTFVIMFTVLTFVGKPTDTLFRLVNLFFNAAGSITAMCTLAVGMLAGRRILAGRNAAAQATDEAHVAAEQATKAAQSVNGDLVRRIASAVTPAIEQAARKAADDAVSRVCSDRERSDRGDDPSR